MSLFDPDKHSIRVPAKPMRMLFAIVLLALCSCFAAGLAVRGHSWGYASVAAIAAAACFGAIRLERWSRFLVYLLNLEFAAGWGYLLYIDYRIGVWHYLAGKKLAASLIPDATIVLLMCYCSYAVTINFRHRR